MSIQPVISRGWYFEIEYDNGGHNPPRVVNAQSYDDWSDENLRRMLEYIWRDY